MKMKFNPRLFCLTATASVACAMVFATSGCGGKPEGGAGLCKLTCSDARIATNIKIVPTQSSVSIMCSTGQDFTLSLIWKIIQKLPPGTDASNPTTTTTDPATANEKPMASVSVDPTWSMITMLTSKDNFCSDACGVVKLDFTVPCKVQSLPVDIHSGATSGTSPVNVSVTLP